MFGNILLEGTNLAIM